MDLAGVSAVEVHVDGRVVIINHADVLLSLLRQVSL